MTGTVGLYKEILRAVLPDVDKAIIALAWAYSAASYAALHTIWVISSSRVYSLCAFVDE